MNAIIAKCSCGRAYTRPEWDRLGRLPNAVYDWGEVHELRNCTCRSTIAVVVKEGSTRFDRI